MVLRSPALSVLLAAVTSLFVAAPAFSETYDEHLTSSKTHLRIVNLIGQVHVTKAAGADFDVVVHVQGKDANRDRISVQFDEATENLVVHYPLNEGTHFVYPALGSGRSSFYWNPDHGPMRFGIKDLIGLGDHRKINVTGSGDSPELWADIDVQVPAHAHLEVVDGLGTISAQDAAADLTLEIQSGPIQAERIDGTLSADTGSGSVTLSAVNGKVTADTGSGRVSVQDVNGDLDLDTGSGSVTVERSHGTRLHADTGSGSVHLSEIACDDLKVDTGSGRIEVQNGDVGKGWFDTGSGGVELVLDQLHGGPIRVDTGSGSVLLDLPPDPSVTVDASTGGGGINVDLENVKWTKMDREEKSFQVGNGEAHVSLETGSGSIHVKS
jgi:putative adhesin